MESKSVKGWEGLYEVYIDGTVKTIQRVYDRMDRWGKHKITMTVKSKIKIANLGKNGYMTIALVRENKTHTTSLHRIIAEAFIPNPENKKCINHKNGIKTDNRIENLEWVTHSENNIHALETGLRNPAHAQSKEFINSVFELRNIGMTNRKIAEQLNSTEYIICGITSGRTHRYTALNYKELENDLRKLLNNQP